jgi:hypothetical protein
VLRFAGCELVDLASLSLARHSNGAMSTSLEAAIVAAVAAANASIILREGNCSDPLASILATMHCIQGKNASCATAGYNTQQFAKLHNDVDTHTTIDSGEQFWTQAFALLSFQLNVSDARNLEPNLAHLRYVETVTFTDGATLGLEPSSTYPFGQMYVQHEDAFVTTDGDCKLVKWDLYGDNAEQEAVTDNVNDLLCLLGVLLPPGAPCDTNRTSTANGTRSSAPHDIDVPDPPEQEQQQVPPSFRGTTQTSSAGPVSNLRLLWAALVAAAAPSALLLA